MSLIIYHSPIVECDTVTADVLGRLNAKASETRLCMWFQKPWKCPFPMDNHECSSVQCSSVPHLLMFKTELIDPFFHDNENIPREIPVEIYQYREKNLWAGFDRNRGRKAEWHRHMEGRRDIPEGSTSVQQRQQTGNKNIFIFQQISINVYYW